MLRIALVFGGRSAEHEISLLSARTLIHILSKNKKYHLLPMGVTREGTWLLVQDWQNALSSQKTLPRPLNEKMGQKLALVPGCPGFFYNMETHQNLPVDVVFSALHGSYGEDGSLQGLVKQLGLGLVGNGVLASAIAMDKDIMKRLLQHNKIPVADYLLVLHHEQDEVHFEDIEASLGLPFYVKPANQGSSVGIHRVTQASEFQGALQDAFRYDHKILIERNIVGRELECAILGNETYKASLVGEVLVEDGFYSYQAKYIDSQGVRLDMPADISPQEQKLAQETALRTAKILGLEGLARVDMFLETSGRILVNEVNTLPGFTDISMYPGLWEKSGLALSDLLDALLNLALERAKSEA